MNNRTSLAQREEVIRRTVYVSDIDHQVCWSLDCYFSFWLYCFVCIVLSLGIDLAVCRLLKNNLQLSLLTADRYCISIWYIDVHFYFLWWRFAFLSNLLLFLGLRWLTVVFVATLIPFSGLHLLSLLMRVCCQTELCVMSMFWMYDISLLDMVDEFGRC